LRVLYQIQSQLGAFTPRKFNARANPAALQAQQIRVPAAGDTPEQALLFWTRFFLTQVDDSVPLLLTLPLEADWVDVTVGEPGSHACGSGESEEPHSIASANRRPSRTCVLTRPRAHAL
jgi:hypothetical protein